MNQFLRTAWLALLTAVCIWAPSAALAQAAAPAADPLVIDSVGERQRYNLQSESILDGGGVGGLPAQLLIIAVSLVACAGMVVVVVLGFSQKGSEARDSAMRTTAVVFVVYVASLMALIYGHTETVTAIASLLSATIGYLFGRSQAESGQRRPEAEAKPAAH